MPKESVCSICGKNLKGLPYKCKFCGDNFCSDHRLPESHDCFDLAEHKRKVREGKIPRLFERKEIGLKEPKEPRKVIIGLEGPEEKKEVAKKLLKVGIAAFFLFFVIFIGFAALKPTQLKRIFPKVFHPLITAINKSIAGVKVRTPTEVPTVPPPTPTKITVTTGEVTDHDLKTSIKVTLEGKKDSYSLSMTGPEGTEVSNAFITEIQMADGIQSVWMPLVENSTREVAAKPGTYSVLVVDSLKNKVFEKTLGPYSSSNLSITNINTTSTHNKHLGYLIKSILFTVKNNGDLPAYVTEVDVKINTIKYSSTIPKEKEAILLGETATITASEHFPLIYDYLSEGNYTASFTFKFKKEFFKEGKTVAKCTKIIHIPQ